MQVDFMIIGAQKCGTTTLFNILNSHPLIVGCSHKEPHFFSKSDNWRRDINQYQNLFPKTEGSLYFEASTSYTFYPLKNLSIWDDIFDYNPNTKFIYIVRNPIDRVVSAYMHSYERGFTNLSIVEALKNERAYIDRTRYYTQISPYIKKFGRSNVLLIDFEDLVRQKKVALEQISNFLSVDVKQFKDINQTHLNVSVGGHKKHHKFDSLSLPLKAIRKFSPPLWDKITDNSKRSFSGKPTLNPELREMIINMLELEILEMQKLMQKDLGKWMLLEK